MEFTKTLDIVAEPDVLVCGCGCAGIAAAIAAGRTGASTLVVERMGFAGGYITGVVGASFDGFVDLRTGHPVVGGIVFELARLAGGASGDIALERYPPSNDLREFREAPDRTRIHFDLELFKLHTDRLMRQAGVRILYHTHVADVQCHNDRIIGVIVVNKGGLGLIRPKMVIDATGDADVAAWAGAPYDINEEMQPMSLHFRVANVQNISAELRDQCSEVLEQAHATGKLSLFGGPWLGHLGPGELYVNATRFAGDGLNPNDLTAAEIQGREDARLMFELWQQHVPGFKDAYFVASGPIVGVRETRRIVGDKILTLNDILEYRRQKDVITLGAWYLDRHPKHSSGYHVHRVIRPYDISYRTLLPQRLANVWVAGRCHSAESAALASSRVTITAMGMGQAAGTAAAMAVKGGQDSRALSMSKLQARLLADGAIILDRADKVLEIGDTLGDAAPESALR